MAIRYYNAKVAQLQKLRTDVANGINLQEINDLVRGSYRKDDSGNVDPRLLNLLEKMKRRKRAHDEISQDEPMFPGLQQK